jgi:hypothetical protein
MRSRLLLFLSLCLLALAGCVTEDIKETGITRAMAIGIAERHCTQYPDRFGYVDRAEWNPDGRFWLVALTDRDSVQGRAYKINRAGNIIDSHVIDRPEEGYGPGHFGYGYGWYGW